MSNIGTPDWQRGSVSAGTLLASETFPTKSVTLEIPANAYSIGVYCSSTTGITVEVLGTTTNTQYPGVTRFSESVPVARTWEVFTVAPSADANITVTITGGGTVGDWWVTCGSEISALSVFELVALQQEPNVPPVNFGILAIGSDGTDARILSTNASGQLQVEIANMIIPSPTVTGPDAYGDPAVVGVSADYARGDHDHGLPAAPSSAPLSVTQYGPTTDPGYAISTTAMAAVDTTNLTTSSFTVPASGKIKVTVSGVIIFGNTYLLYLSMLDHSTHSQVGDTVAASNGFAASWPVAFTKTYIISGLGAGSKQLDLAMYTTNTATSLHALVSATPAKNDYGPITILIEAA